MRFGCDMSALCFLGFDVYVGGAVKGVLAAFISMGVILENYEWKVEMFLFTNGWKWNEASLHLTVRESGNIYVRRN